MAPLALLSRFQNDAHVRVIDVKGEQTMDEVAAACAAPAVDRQVRHPDLSKPLRIRMTSPKDDSPPLARNMTVRDAGLRHFDCVDVFVE